MFTPPPLRQRRHRSLPASLCFLAAAALLATFFAWPHVFDGGSASSASATTDLAVQGDVQRQKPISEIRVGDRVPGRNPQLDDLDRLVPEPDPANWRKITLNMSKPDGHEIDIELLRPVRWIDQQGAHTGATVKLTLFELGADGDASVLAIDPCPTIRPGAGNVVTGTFAHSATNVIDVGLDGQDDPIGCTANHPFWSVDRDDFVAAGELQAGEQVLARNGQALRVTRQVPRRGPQRVYNIEVHREHVFCVGSAGTLVHNVCEFTHYRRVAGRNADADELFNVLKPHTRKNSNVAAAIVEVNGNRQVIGPFRNLEKSRFPLGRHSEELMANELRHLVDQGDEVKILAVFSEKNPCGKLGNNCRNLLNMMSEGALDQGNRLVPNDFPVFWIRQ